MVVCGSFKKITNSNVLDDIFDIPESMKNKKIVVTVSLYEDKDNTKLKDLRGALSKYKNEDLIKIEKDAWAEILENNEVFIPNEVIAETIYILEKVYKVKNDEISYKKILTPYR